MKNLLTNFELESKLKRIAKSGKQLKTVMFLSLILFLSTTSNAQEREIQRIPVYEVAYEYPSVDNIKDVINRVRDYYLSTSTLTIVDSKTGKAINDFSTFNPNAEPSRGFSSEWSYTNGVVLSAFEYIDDVTGDKTFFNNNIKFFDYVVNNLPYFETNKAHIKRSKIGGWGRILEFEALDDCGSIGAAMIKTYMKTKNEAYLKLIHRVDEHVSENQFRLDDGTLARHRPQYESLWADDLYMSVPFLVNMGVLTGDNKYFDDAIRQLLQMAERLYIPQMELFDHGWSVTSGDYDPRFYWGRANGWTLMAMAEVLENVPEGYKGRDEVLHLYRSMIRSLANLQDGTGFWHNLLDKNDTYLETSCTAMFTYAIAKGINEGWINHVYGPVALTGWNALATRIDDNGAVDGTCEGTTFAHDNSCYGGEAQQPGNPKLNFSTFNIVANYYKSGPATNPGEVSYRIANPSGRGTDDHGQWYIAENFVVGNKKVSNDNWDGGVQTKLEIEKIRLKKPWQAMTINQQIATEAYRLVLENAGATLPKRDAIGIRIIAETKGGFAKYEGSVYKQKKRVADKTIICGIIDSQNDVGAWPELKSTKAPNDSDHDGMPDLWEEQNKLDPQNPDDRNMVSSSGYTMLEKYLNSIL